MTYPSKNIYNNSFSRTLQVTKRQIYSRQTLLIYFFILIVQCLYDSHEEADVNGVVSWSTV